jgi:hypothetical protein
MTLFQYVFTPLCWLLTLASALGVLGIGVGYLVARSRGRTVRRPRRLAVVAGLLTISIPYWLILPRTLDPFSRRSFNPAAWRRATGSRNATRGMMTGDLLRFHLHRGMTYETAIRLLGWPDMWDSDNHGHSILRYRLGPTSGRTIDYLDLLFNRGGRLDGVEIWQS